MPEVNRELVRRIASALFSERAEDAMRRLDAYGVEPYEGERERVQLAILKLCDEHELRDLDRLVDAAKQDYRDVLVWAEYPNQLDTEPRSLANPGEKSPVTEADRAQYVAWLRRFDPVD